MSGLDIPTLDAILDQMIAEDAIDISSAAAPAPQANSDCQSQPGSGGLASTPELDDVVKFNHKLDDFDIAVEDSEVGTIVPPNGSNLQSLLTVAVGDLGGLESKLDWATYQQKIKEVFIKSRPFEEVFKFAANMNFKDWLEFVLKLLPKDIKIQGDINFKHFLEEFGPVDKSKYLPEPSTVTDVEFSDVTAEPV